MHDLKSLLEQSDDLPSLPEIYIKVSELLDNDNASAFDIGDAVQTDPSLTSKILKMVNSAYFGLPSQVLSVSQAVSLLGRKQLSNILMGSVLVELFSDSLIENFSMSQFWHHSIETAIISRHLALQNANIIDHDAFFTAGLLHDIGRLVLAKVIPDSLADVNELVQSKNIDIITAEQQVLGFTHVDAGEMIMKKWGLPSLLIQCIAKHHHTDHKGPFAIETSIVYLANQLSQHALPENEEETAEILKTIQNWEICDCPVDQIAIACELATEQSAEVLASFGMQDMTIED